MAVECQLGVIRSINEQEVDLIRLWRNDPGIRRFMYTQHEIQPEEHFAWWARIQDNPAELYFMYEYEDNPAGVAAFNKIDEINKCSSLSIYLAPHAIRGCGSRLAYLMLDYAFGTLKLHKVYCEALAFNLRATRLYEKMGFLKEGVFREQYMHGNKHVDIYRFGITSNEWELKRISAYAKMG